MGGLHVRAMFESLSTRLQDVFRSLRGEARLTEQIVEVALREIRLALLEADVNFKVVKAFVDRVRDKAVDQAVLGSLSPAQQVVRIVRDEMLALFGDAPGGLAADVTVAARDPAARAAGLGQDDHERQAGAVADPAGTPPAAGVDRRAAAGGHPAVGAGGQAGRGGGVRSRPAISTRCRARAARWSMPGNAGSTW